MCKEKQSVAEFGRLSIVTTLVVGASFVFCIFGYVYRHYYLRVFGLSIVDFEFSPFDAAFFAISQISDVRVLAVFICVASPAVAFLLLSASLPRFVFVLALPIVSGLLLIVVLIGARAIGEIRAKEVWAEGAGRVIFCEASGADSQGHEIWPVGQPGSIVKLLVMTEEYYYVFRSELMVQDQAVPPMAAAIPRSRVGNCYFDGYRP